MLIIVNSISVQIANRLNMVFVLLKVVTIVTIIVVGVIRLAQGLYHNKKAISCVE